MNSQQCLTMMTALRGGCQSDAEFWQAVAEMQRPGAGAEPKRRGPLPLAERTPEQQAAHAAKKAARAAEKASGGGAEAFADKWLSASASASASASDAEGAPKKRGPKPLAERTPEQQAAHAAKKAARAAEKASASAPAAAAAEPKPNAWLTLVADTVKQMAERGWTSWTDAKGNVWAGSVAGPDGRHVYAEGPHAGKAPSHQRGGMARASYIKSGVVGLQGEWAEME